MHTVGKANKGQHCNGVSTLGAGGGGAGIRQPPTHLQLHKGGGSRPSSPVVAGSVGRNRRPLHLFTQANLNCNDNEKAVHTPPSSDEDNSPTELNNCKRLVDKPPLNKITNDENPNISSQEVKVDNLFQYQYHQYFEVY
ncbi:unnamed protein product [Ceratitis capitata]|uniref:(Mediterranean fruit fly) hypothetical protein n=1 Tax=Ceratitis capitata TaxID=7213 RepID=A0A811V0Y2_CERCA|nr:unnamed protein product [Ceratitis capitata]